MSGTPQYIDISVFNQVTDWPAYIAWSKQWDNISRIAMRSSYGAGFVDDKFRSFRAAALANGIDQIIYYHYAYPQLNDAKNEATWQQEVVGNIRTQDVIMLDFEEQVPQANAQWAIEWLAAQAAFYKRQPTIYASLSFIQVHLQDSRLAAFPLTLADWQFTPDERPQCPAPWKQYKYLQYTDRASNIPGVSGSVDCNVYLGVPDMMITIANSSVSNYFKETSPGVWTCMNGNTIHGEILAFYQNYPGQGLAGFTDLGLPLSGEIPLDDKGNVTQKFERGDLNFDPLHVHDNPPGAGRVYKAHIPASNAALKAELLAEAKLVGDTTQQMISVIAAQL